MKRAVAPLGAALLLAACASPQWRHPSIADEIRAKDAATLALAQCEAYAQGLAPMPSGPRYMPVPASGSYYTSGTVSTYGNTSYVNAYTRSGGGFSQEFAKGYNGGTALGQAAAEIASRRKQAEIAAACMRQQGWVDARSEEGKKLLEKNLFDFYFFVCTPTT